MPKGSISQQPERPDTNKRHASHAVNFQQSPDNSEEPGYDEEMAAQFEPAFGIVPGRAYGDARLTAFQFRVFALMCGYANRKDHICWPKQETLAKILHTSVKVISNITIQLQKLDYVEVAKSGYPARNVYRILWDEPKKKPLADYLPASESTGQWSQASESIPQWTQSPFPSGLRVHSPVDSYNRPLEQTIRTSSSRDDLSSTSLAPLARTRGRFDQAALRRDPLFIAVCAYLPEPVLDAEWQQWRAMLNQLHRGGVRAADIATAVKGWQLRWDIAKLTLPALVHHWAEIREGKSSEQVATSIRNRNAAHAERAAQQRRIEQRAEFQREYNAALRLPADTPLPAGVYDSPGAGLTGDGR